MSYVVYSGHDADGELVYVGFSKNLPLRVAHHRRHTPWWAGIVDRVEVMFSTPHREEAMAFEAEAITALRPLQNRVHNPVWSSVAARRAMPRSAPAGSDTRKRVEEMFARGAKPRDIAAVLGVSTQRVYQQLAALELPTPTRNGANQ